MPTIDDIDAAKETCLAALGARIEAARDLKESATGEDSERLSDAIDQLKDERLVILTQQYVADLNSDAMQRALDTISKATSDMNAVAQTMKTVTDFINKVAALLGAGATVMPALTGTDS